MILPRDSNSLASEAPKSKRAKSYELDEQAESAISTHYSSLGQNDVGEARSSLDSLRQIANNLREEIQRLKEELRLEREANSVLKLETDDLRQRNHALQERLTSLARGMILHVFLSSYQEPIPFLL